MFATELKHFSICFIVSAESVPHRMCRTRELSEFLHIALQLTGRKQAMGTPRIAMVLAGILCAALVAGCEKKNDPPKPTATVQPGGPANQSVALPQNSLPQPDAAIPPQAPPAAPSPTDASNQSQASPKELEKSQESAAMPMPGQVNNHSTPQPLDSSPKQ